MNLILAFLFGAAVGVPMCFALGPVFFALLQNSMTNGFKSAFIIALGVIVADIILFGLAYTGTNIFIEGQDDASKYNLNFWVQVVGGTILFAMGFFTIRKHVTETNEIKIFHNPVMYFMRGFAMNFLNPVNFFAWVVLISNINLQFPIPGHAYERYVFYSATLFSILATETFICYFANRIRKVLSTRLIRLISTVIGLIFIGCSVWLFGNAFRLFN